MKSTPSCFADSTSAKPKRLFVATEPVAAWFNLTIAAREPARTTNQTTHSARARALGIIADEHVIPREARRSGRRPRRRDRECQPQLVACIHDDVAVVDGRQELAHV